MLVYVAGVFFVVIVLFFYLNGRRSENYWKKRGVKYYGRNKNFGLFWDFLMQPYRSNIECISNVYSVFKGEPAVGFGCMFCPGLLVIDPVNSQFVLENDFQSFNDRGLEPNEHDVLASNSLNLQNGVKWKLLRQNITRLFTTTKLKDMFYALDCVSIEFVKYLKDNPKRTETTARTLKRFNAAATNATIFGIKTTPIFDTYYVNVVETAFPATIKSHIRVAIALVVPIIGKLLGLKFFGKVEDSFMKTLRLIIKNKKRNNAGSGRHFTELNLLNSEILKDDNSNFQLKVTEEVLAASILVTLAAGVEAGTTVVLAALMSLANYPEVQKKLLEEVNDVYEKCNGELSYDIFMQMSYLDKVVNETLRMYPPLSFLTRKCIENTVLPAGNIRIDKGTLLLIPTYQYHYDPKYFPSPEVFDPDRFADLSLLKASTYIPFGKGPRMCIAFRYANLQTKVILFHIVRSFKLEIIPGKDQVISRKNIFLMDLTDMSLKLIPRV